MSCEVEAKKQFRKEALREMKKQSKPLQGLVILHARRLLKRLKAKKVLVFIPLKDEADVLKLCGGQTKLRCEFFSTFMQNQSLKIVKLNRPFSKAAFGVRQSSAKCEFRGKLDTAIVPCVGVDGAWARVGRGMGFYDRLFERLKGQKRRLNVIFVGGVKTNKVISQHHDLVGDFYITPHKVFQRTKNVGSFSGSCRVGSGWDRRWRFHHKAQ